MSLKAPVAWAVMNDQGVICDIRVTNPPYIQPMVTGMETPIPLYLSPTLTEAEREAIGVATQCIQAQMAQHHPEETEAHELLEKSLAALRSLLDRTE